MSFIEQTDNLRKKCLVGEVDVVCCGLFIFFRVIHILLFYKQS